MSPMSRAALAIVVLTACHHAPVSHETRGECPGPYAVGRATCELPPPVGCKGVCGYILRRGTCAPVKGATVFPYVPNQSVPNAVADETGRFDLVGVPPGHYTIRVMAAQDDAHFDLEIVGGEQPIPAPLELHLTERSCACGGACPT